ncbi:MAG TPA: isocitrate lyase/phosphoenolpyruvate mutase family protein [Candidatus Binatia bacterium]|nr:isocitrate lyase/phosphoenolpyruvate mutase family protein [Candidatus Binatia bacterium]
MPPSIAELLATGEPVVLPGVYDALSARLAAAAGFRAIFLSGFAMAATRLGRPDIGLLTQTEVLDTARLVCAASPCPVVVDIDTGWGGPLNVERTVAELLRLGAAGCFLEDQEWPKRCGHLEGKRIVPLDEYLPKLHAALRIPGDRPFHVTARTDARAVAGLDEAVRRARAYAEAGADAVFVEAPESIDEMTAVRAAVPRHVPLVANMVEQGKTPVRTAAELGAAGYGLVVVPVAGLLASAHALRDVYRTLRSDGETRALAARMLGFAEMNAFLGLDELYRRDAAWRGGR